MARRTQMQGSFPLKLHQLLNTVHDEGLEWIVSWSLQGNGFKVHKVKEFVSFILPRFFIRQTKYQSFQNQLVSHAGCRREGESCRHQNASSKERNFEIVSTSLFSHRHSHTWRNIWDFDRITKGPFAGSYVHSKFLRGHPHLFFDMVRQTSLLLFESGRRVRKKYPTWRWKELGGRYRNHWAQHQWANHDDGLWIPWSARKWSPNDLEWVACLLLRKG